MPSHLQCALSRRQWLQAELALAAHYGFDPEKNGVYKAASRLKENTTISRTGYGELKIKVWTSVQLR